MSSTAVMGMMMSSEGNGDEGEAGGGRKDIHSEGGVLGIGQRKLVYKAKGLKDNGS